MYRFQTARVSLEQIEKGTSGVYQIRCSDGRIYIGSSVDIRTRWSKHLRDLQCNTHSNSRLQRAWNSVDALTFEFRLLEQVDRSQLLIAEQWWIERTLCANLEYGFNIASKAGAPGSHVAQTWEGFINPAGETVTIHNLFAFCREHKLDFPSMYRLSVGKSKLKSYKGWRHHNSVRKRDFIKVHAGFIDPQGHPVEAIVNLAAFCREHHLDDTHMLAVSRGRICSHRGWTHVNGRQRRDVKTYDGFVSPSGERIRISNLRQFCRENDLQVVKMYSLKSGNIHHHKGWTWRGEDDDCSQES